jgi:hypothetical protein
MSAKKLIWGLSLAVLALGAILLAVAPQHPNIRQPVLALELVRNWAELSIVLAVDPAERAKFLTHTRIDIAFLAAYTALFVTLALHVLRRHWRWIAAGLAIAAGIADAGENLAILNVLPLERGFENFMAQTIRQWSLTKWALLGVVWVMLGVGHFRQPIAGGLYVVAGLLTLAGCVEHRWLEVAVIPVLIAAMWQVWTYWPAKAAASLSSRSTASGSSVS